MYPPRAWCLTVYTRLIAMYTSTLWCYVSITKQADGDTLPGAHAVGRNPAPPGMLKKHAKNSEINCLLHCVEFLPSSPAIVPFSSYIALIEYKALHILNIVSCPAKGSPCLLRFAEMRLLPGREHPTQNFTGNTETPSGFSALQISQTWISDHKPEL